jgi:hypothetical protein
VLQKSATNPLPLMVAVHGQIMDVDQSACFKSRKTNEARGYTQWYLTFPSQKH